MQSRTATGLLRPVAIFQIFVFVGIFFSGVLYSQETTGAIEGVISDNTGAAIPGATVSVSGTGLPQGRTVKTDSAGRYVFSALPSGTYSITASAAGFTVLKQADLNIFVGRTIKADLTLQVGNVSESVVVTSDAVIVDTTQSQVAVNVTSEFYDRLPKTRSFDSLIAIAPGVRAESIGGGYSIDGASGSENTYLVEGTDVTNLQDGTLPRNNNIPTEFVQETQVKSSGFEAQYGGAVGGVVSTLVRSGANDFHGSASLYTLFDATNARSRGVCEDQYYQDGGGRHCQALYLDPNDANRAAYYRDNKDGYTNLNPSFTLGGPILKNKLWFFSGWAPMFETQDRRVDFTDETSGNYTQKVRSDWLTTKLDYQPFQKLRTNFTYLYSPFKANGLLPTSRGTDTPDADYRNFGYRYPSASYLYSVDYTPTAKLLISFHGGYNYRNRKDYGLPTGVWQYFENNSSESSLPVPTQFGGPSGEQSPDPRQTLKDIQTRTNYQFDVSYIANFLGTHNLKGGYQYTKLHNNAEADAYPNGYARIYWGRSYSPVTGGPSQSGPYGYYRFREFSTTGDVSSSNIGLYIQDNWKVTRTLTLNLGLRTEREVVPSFRIANNLPSDAIKFPFGDKLAPRLGFAWDVFGNTKLKVFGGFGYFYDIMKYELPRGSFGGDIYTDSYYTLDSPDWTSISRTNLPGNFIEFLDRRIPSNDPSQGLLDPNLKPVKSRNVDVGAEYSLTSNTVASLRYTRRDLLQTIEDVGLLTPQGEQYFITNPGYGYSIDPEKLGGYPPTPKAKRTYNAVELSINRRFAANWIGSASYTYSRLYGNYSGLASSDENGRNSPNVNRYFDLPWIALDASGQPTYGLLATDRPSTVKLFLSYSLKHKFGTTNFAPIFFGFSGTPLTTAVNIGGVPVFANGRGDMGRIPFYTNTDFQVAHEFAPFKNHESWKARFEVNFRNIFNQNTATNYYSSYIHTSDSGGSLNLDDYQVLYNGFGDYKAAIQDAGLRVDPRYGQPLEFQLPRQIRFGFQFIF